MRRPISGPISSQSFTGASRRGVYYPLFAVSVSFALRIISAYDGGLYTRRYLRRGSPHLRLDLHSSLPFSLSLFVSFFSFSFSRNSLGFILILKVKIKAFGEMSKEVERDGWTMEKREGRVKPCIQARLSRWGYHTC